jgi:hypothetical protein
VIVPPGSGAAAGPSGVAVLGRVVTGAGNVALRDDTFADDGVFGEESEVPLVQPTTISIETVTVVSNPAVRTVDFMTRPLIQ